MDGFGATLVILLACFFTVHTSPCSALDTYGAACDEVVPATAKHVLVNPPLPDDCPDADYFNYISIPYDAPYSRIDTPAFAAMDEDPTNPEIIRFAAADCSSWSAGTLSLSELEYCRFLTDGTVITSFEYHFLERSLENPASVFSGSGTAYPFSVSVRVLSEPSVYVNVTVGENTEDRSAFVMFWVTAGKRLGWWFSFSSTNKCERALMTSGELISGIVMYPVVVILIILTIVGCITLWCCVCKCIQAKKHREAMMASGDNPSEYELVRKPGFFAKLFGGRRNSVKISGPIKFSQGMHIGVDVGGFQLTNLPPEWKALFLEAGVGEEAMADPEVAGRVMGALQQWGGSKGGGGGSSGQRKQMVKKKRVVKKRVRKGGSGTSGSRRKKKRRRRRKRPSERAPLLNSSSGGGGGDLMSPPTTHHQRGASHAARSDPKPPSHSHVHSEASFRNYRRPLNMPSAVTRDEFSRERASEDPPPFSSKSFIPRAPRPDPPARVEVSSSSFRRAAPPTAPSRAGSRWGDGDSGDSGGGSKWDSGGSSSSYSAPAQDRWDSDPSPYVPARKDPPPALPTRSFDPPPPPERTTTSASSYDDGGGGNDDFAFQDDGGDLMLPPDGHTGGNTGGGYSDDPIPGEDPKEAKRRAKEEAAERKRAEKERRAREKAERAEEKRRLAEEKKAAKQAAKEERAREREAKKAKVQTNPADFLRRHHQAHGGQVEEVAEDDESEGEWTYGSTDEEEGEMEEVEVEEEYYEEETVPGGGGGGALEMDPTQFSAQQKTDLMGLLRGALGARAGAMVGGDDDESDGDDYY